MTKSARDIFHRHLCDDLKVSYEIISLFDVYHNLLVKWQNKLNLVSNTRDIWSRHFLDSSQLAKLISTKNSSLIDFGSGAGFPPMVMALLGYNNITAVESETKKCVFLREIARATSVNIEIINGRIEDQAGRPFDYVTSRACAPLTELLKYSFPFVSHGTICLFLKGRKYATELEKAKRNWLFDCEVIPSITSDDGVILSITNLKYKDRANHDKLKKPKNKFTS